MKIQITEKQLNGIVKRFINESKERILNKIKEELENNLSFLKINEIYFDGNIIKINVDFSNNFDINSISDKTYAYDELFQIKKFMRKNISDMGNAFKFELVLSDKILKVFKIEFETVEERLEKYAKDTNNNFFEMKMYFKSEADPYNLKTPSEVLKIYKKNVDEFLTKQGY